eukprot:330055_1
MASMADVIKFRVLSSKLYSAEFNAFILEFIQECGRDILVTSLFNRFITNNTAQNGHHQPLTTCIGIMKHIMELRKHKPNTLSQTKIAIHSLSPDLIGETSSYLCHHDNIAFGEVNRAIYIGCNTPNTLRKLDLTAVNDYSVVSLRKYPHLQCLAITLNQFHQLLLPNHLQELTIEGNEARDLNLNPNIVEMNNLGQINLHSFGQYDNQQRLRYHGRSLTELISMIHAHNIQYLRVENVWTDTKMDDIGSSLVGLLPNLRGFEWNGGYNETRNHFMELFGEQLVFLSFWVTGLPIPNISWNHLEQLIIGDPDTFTLNSVLKTARRLKRVELILDSAIDDNKDALADTIVKIIRNNALLSCVEIITTNNTNGDAVYQALECALDKCELDKYAIELKGKGIILTEIHKSVECWLMPQCI